MVKQKLRGSRSRNGRAELWEEIPEELLASWEGEGGENVAAGGGGRGGAGGGSVASSGLSEVSDFVEEEGGDDEDFTPRHSTSTAVASSSRHPQAMEVDEKVEEVEVKEEKKVTVSVEEEPSNLDNALELESDNHMMKWEKDYWAERARCDKPDFIEWEAVSFYFSPSSKFPFSIVLHLILSSRRSVLQWKNGKTLSTSFQKRRIRRRKL